MNAAKRQQSKYLNYLDYEWVNLLIQVPKIPQSWHIQIIFIYFQDRPYFGKEVCASPKHEPKLLVMGDECPSDCTKDLELNAKDFTINRDTGELEIHKTAAFKV